MKVLWVATKPPWPCTDGGRLLTYLTLEALCARGVEIECVAPYDPTNDDDAATAKAMAQIIGIRLVPHKKRSPVATLARSVVSGEPLSIARHRALGVARAVTSLLAQHQFDVVHAEHLQALPQCEAARRLGVPIVLRCHNVESDLWRAGGATRASLMRVEANRLARFEGNAVRSSAAALALTAADSSRLTRLAETAIAGDQEAGPLIETIAAPFPAELPQAEHRLAGDPALVLLGSTGWHVNDDGARWLLTNAWPQIRAGNAGAILHVFGERNPARLLSGSGSNLTADERVSWRSHLAESRVAFAPGSILLVPLRFASGVRMRILEAWSRGIAVVATPAAVHGMNVTSGAEALLGNNGDQLMQAVRRLHREPGTYTGLVQAGRARLRSEHDPNDIAAALLDVYERACASARATGSPITK